MQHSIHFIEFPGLWLSVRGGELAIRQRDGRYIDLDRRVKVIVAAARGFCVTSPAVRYCLAKHIELFISDDVAAFVSLFGPEVRGDARRTALKVRERQFRAAFDKRKTVAIAREMVAKKVKAEGHTRPVTQTLLTGLQRAKTADDVRHIEAQAAQVWWSQWTDFEMRFPDPTVTADWRSSDADRAKLGELAAQFTARSAIHPIQAMLNFATAIVAARLTRAIIAVGLDPCFGFLHDGRKPGRLSLVWDAVEPLRPRVVRAVFGYVATHEFERRDFLVFVHKITAERTVRLTAELAKEIVEVAVNAVSVKECVKDGRMSC